MRRTRATQATTPPEIHKPDEQWRQELIQQQYDVLRRGHTEPAFILR
jgi:peptide methionine sulfoxide reductase MsrB